LNLTRVGSSITIIYISQRGKIKTVRDYITIILLAG
jgi:hypothetical protein